MTFRLPQNLTTQLSVETGASALEKAILSEHAASLGHYGRRVAKAMADWECRDPNDAQDTQRCLDAAVEAVYNCFVQREAIGLSNHDYPVQYYKIPPAVLARVGAMDSRERP